MMAEVTSRNVLTTYASRPDSTSDVMASDAITASDLARDHGAPDYVETIRRSPPRATPESTTTPRSSVERTTPEADDEPSAAESTTRRSESGSSTGSSHRLSRALSELSDLFQADVEILITPVDDDPSHAVFSPVSPTSELDTSGICDSLADSVRSIEALSEQLGADTLHRQGSLDRVAFSDQLCVRRERDNHDRSSAEYQTKRHSDGLAYSFFTPQSPVATRHRSAGSRSLSERGVEGYSTCISRETLRSPRTCEERVQTEMALQTKTDDQLLDDLLQDLLSVSAVEPAKVNGATSRSGTVVSTQRTTYHARYERQPGQRACREEHVRRSASVSSSCSLCGYSDRLSHGSKTHRHCDVTDSYDRRAARHQTPPIPTDDVDTAVACLSDTIASGCDSQMLEDVVIATMRHNISRQTRSCCRDGSPESCLDDVLETAETQIYSGDVTLRRVFAVKEEYRRVPSTHHAPAENAEGNQYKSRVMHGKIVTDAHGDDIEGEYYTSTAFCRNLQRGTSPETMLERALETITDIDDTFTSPNTTVDDKTVTPAKLHNGYLEDGYGYNAYTNIARAAPSSSCECVADGSSTSLDVDTERTSTREGSTESDASTDEVHTNSNENFHKLIGETLRMTDRILSSFSHIDCDQLSEDGLIDSDEAVKSIPIKPEPVGKTTARNVGKSPTPERAIIQGKTAASKLNATPERQDMLKKIFIESESSDNRINGSSNSLLDRTYDSESDFILSDICVTTDEEPDLDSLVRGNRPSNFTTSLVGSTECKPKPGVSSPQREVARSPSPIEIVDGHRSIVVDTTRHARACSAERVSEVGSKTDKDTSAERADVSAPYEEITERFKDVDSLKSAIVSRVGAPDETRVLQIADDDAHKSVRYLFNSSTSNESKHHFERLCPEGTVLSYDSDADVKEEHVDVQNVTVLFSWPKSPGPPGVPLRPVGLPRKPFKTYRMRRVTRIRADGVVEVIEGPTCQAIDFRPSSESEKKAEKGETEDVIATKNVPKDVTIDLQYRRTKMNKKVNSKTSDQPMITAAQKWRPIPAPRPKSGSLPVSSPQPASEPMNRSQSIQTNGGYTTADRNSRNNTPSAKRGPKTAPKPNMKNWSPPLKINVIHMRSTGDTVSSKVEKADYNQNSLVDGDDTVFTGEPPDGAPPSCDVMNDVAPNETTV